MGPNNIVTAWTADGAKIVYRNRIGSGFGGKLYTVAKEGELSEVIPRRRTGARPASGSNTPCADQSSRFSCAKLTVSNVGVLFQRRALHLIVLF